MEAFHPLPVFTMDVSGSRVDDLLLVMGTLPCHPHTLDHDLRVAVAACRVGLLGVNARLRFSWIVQMSSSLPGVHA
jgi:hypothetical protein